ncbi:DUF2164 domain-containing protein [Candidatus Woesebacteria bacterium]|nr:DUF2164 domain-containing protein [Candidatus Woesebacteria bacterium]
MKSSPITPQRKKECIALIQAYFLAERDEELGTLAAELIFDFFETQLGPLLYNQAIDDVRAWFTQRLPYLEADLDLLKKDAHLVDAKL